MSINIHVGRKTQGTKYHAYSSLLKNRSEIEIGALQMQILWALSRKSMHGYELMKALGEIKGTKVTQGTMYPTLQRMMKLGLAGRKSEKTGRREKYVYHLTDKGFSTMNAACLEFVRTFYGIFHDFACEKCALHKRK